MFDLHNFEFTEFDVSEFRFVNFMVSRFFKQKEEEFGAYIFRMLELTDFTILVSGDFNLSNVRFLYLEVAIFNFSNLRLSGTRIYEFGFPDVGVSKFLCYYCLIFRSSIFQISRALLLHVFAFISVVISRLIHVSPGSGFPKRVV